MQDRNIIDIAGKAYADVEDGKVFLIHSPEVFLGDPMLEPVVEIIESEGLTLTSAIQRDSTEFDGGQEIVRWFE